MGDTGGGGGTCCIAADGVGRATNSHTPLTCAPFVARLRTLLSGYVCGWSTPPARCAPTVVPQTRLGPVQCSVRQRVCQCKVLVYGTDACTLPLVFVQARSFVHSVLAFIGVSAQTTTLPRTWCTTPKSGHWKWCRYGGWLHAHCVTCDCTDMWCAPRRPIVSTETGGTGYQPSHTSTLGTCCCGC